MRVGHTCLRRALAARLDDLERDTRSEALVGSAYRRGPRTLPWVRDALSRACGNVWGLEVIAAGVLASPEAARRGPTSPRRMEHREEERTAHAVKRLTEPAGPGTDVVDGIADLSRRHAHGRADGDAPHAVASDG